VFPASPVTLYRYEFGKGGVVDPAAVPGSHPGIN
jgi:hypothetical protein